MAVAVAVAVPVAMSVPLSLSPQVTRSYDGAGGPPAPSTDLVHDQHPVEQPAPPEEGYHFGVDITDKTIQYIDDVKAIAPERPVFLYYAPGCAHAPHQAPPEWIERYRGRFDAGYEAMREEILAR
ncbi:hypothetical protein [Streptomyces sp. NPDC058583]|uniref:hypothetical protein n=1 Tax=unclassified Streptomyces TaxID=2593676 RepID=UPI00366597C2